MNEFISSLSPREVALIGAAGAAAHAVHLAWPNIKSSAISISRAYPWLRDNGGIRGVLAAILVGQPKPTPAPVPAPQPEKTT